MKVILYGKEYFISGTSFEGLYYTVTKTGRIEINEPFCRFLTYLFAKAGINIKKISSPIEFEKAFKLSNGYFDEAMQWETSKLNNKYYSKAFNDLLKKDFSTFDEDIQKGNQLQLLRKNIISN